MNEPKASLEEMMRAAVTRVQQIRAWTPEKNSQEIVEAAFEAAGVAAMAERIAELEARIVTIRGTVVAHDVRLESCDRDGQEFCDCLERAMKSAGGASE